MPEPNEFTELLDEIDHVLTSYDPGELDPDKAAREIFIERANQRPILEKAIQLATNGLVKYPHNVELVRRRALARCLIVTPEGDHPELESAEKDLRTILEFDPNNLYAGLDLLDAMFTFNGMEDNDVAEVADNFARRAEKLLLEFRSLQIRALAYAGQHVEAEQVYNRWRELFPDSESLQSAKEDADSI